MKRKLSMDLSIILVNWNSMNYLRECIPSVYEWTHGISFEIIVVDNASPEGNVDALKSEFPQIRLIKSSENVGFAGANNIGFVESGGRNILFLNPDTKLISRAINVMFERLQSLPNAGIVGCKQLNGDLSIQTSSILMFPTIANQVLQSEYLRLRWPGFRLWDISPLFARDAKPAEVQAISGACMMVKREVFEKVGMFSEEYFMYAEDMDLCYKVRQAGLTNYCVSEAEIIHYAGKSSNPEWATIMKLKAELRFSTKFRGRFYGFLFRVALAINALVRTSIARMFSFFGDKESALATASKYNAILKTLLMHSGKDGNTRRTPKNASSCGVSEV